MMNINANIIGAKRNHASFDPVYASLVTAAQGYGYTAPSISEQQKQSDFLSELRAASLLSRMKFGNLYGYGSEEFGRINIANTAQRNTVTGTITYSHGNGAKSNGSSFYTSPFMSQQYAGIETNSTFIGYVSESSSELTNSVLFEIFDAATFVLVMPIRTNGDLDFSCYTGSIEVGGPNSDHKGLYITTHNVPTTIYHDGTKINGGQPAVAPAGNEAMTIFFFCIVWRNILYKICCWCFCI